MDMSLGARREDAMQTAPHWSDYFFFPNIKQKQMIPSVQKDTPPTYPMATTQNPPGPYLKEEENPPIGRHNWDLVMPNMHPYERTFSLSTYKGTSSRRRKTVIFACLGVVLLALTATATAVVFHIHLPSKEEPAAFQSQQTTTAAVRDVTTTPRITTPRITTHRITTSSPTQPTTETATPPPICRGEWTTILPSNVSCARYINCSSRVIYPGLSEFEVECTYPHLFDNITARCIYFTGVDCGGRPVPTSPCEYEANSCHNDTLCIPCENRGISCKGLPDGKNGMPLPNDPNRYIVCVLERTIAVESCPVGLHFDNQSRECALTILPGSAGQVNIAPISPVTYIGDSAPTVECIASKISLSQWQFIKIQKVSYPSVLVVWNRDSSLQFSDKEKYDAISDILEGGSLRLRLWINNITCTDEGIYECSLTTMNGIMMDKTTLTLSANTTDPVIDVPDSIQTGSNFSVTATWFKGYPPLEGDLVWTFRFPSDINYSSLPTDGLTFYRTDEKVDSCLVTQRETFVTEAAPFWTGLEIRVMVTPMPGSGVNSGTQIINRLNGSSGVIKTIV